MNNRAMVLDVESTGVSDDAQATELGWCDVYFDENGQLQPSSKAFVQRCKPELPISFGSMAVSHIYEDELVNEPSHRDVINHIVNDSVTYVIGHNIDYDMKVVANAGQNRQYKRICSLAIAQACYPFDTDHKLLAMCHMLDYDFARQHAKKAHNAKYDVMFCVRILRIMCMHNNITNMEQLYQFSEFCRIPQYMRFGKHKGMAVDEVPLSYKRYLLDKGVEDPYVKIAFERSIAKNLADIAESNRIKAEQKRIAAEQKQAQVDAQAYQQPGLLPQDSTPPYTEELVEPQNVPEMTHEASDNANDTLTAINGEQTEEHASESDPAALAQPLPADNTPSNLAETADDSVDLKSDAIDSNSNENTNESINSDDKDLLLESGDTIQEPTTNEPKDITDTQGVDKEVVSQKDDGAQAKDTVIKTEKTVEASKSNKKEAKTKAKPAKKTKTKPSNCTAPTLDDIPPSFLPDTPESQDDVVETTAPVSTGPEQDDDFYNNPTSYDPMSKPSKADPLYKKKEVSTDPYGNIPGQHQAAPKSDTTNRHL